MEDVARRPSILSASSGAGATSTETDLTVPLNIDANADKAPCITFKTIPKLVKKIDDAKGDALVVQDMSATAFATFDRSRERISRKWRLSYNPSTMNLFITKPDGPHEMMHIALREEMSSNMRSMGLPGWRWLGAKKFTSTRGRGASEPDMCGIPRPPARTKHGWPTLVIESGYSQSLDQLRAKMEWWFDESSHQVKIVILAKMHQSQRTIIIEKYNENWITGHSPTIRPGAMTRAATATAAGGTYNKVCRQLTITYNAGTDPEIPQSHDPARDVPLRLEFQLLFLRPPGPGEGDVIITHQQLQEYAAEVWSQVE